MAVVQLQQIRQEKKKERSHVLNPLSLSFPHGFPPQLPDSYN